MYKSSGAPHWTVPVHMQFFVFNVDNLLEVKQGSRLYVIQKGPYCYRVYQTKMNITWNKNDTVSYNKFTKYVFYPGSSCSSCDPYTNNITLPNLPQVILYFFFFSSLIFWSNIFTWHGNVLHQASREARQSRLSSLVGSITSRCSLSEEPECSALNHFDLVFFLLASLLYSISLAFSF